MKSAGEIHFQATDRNTEETPEGNFPSMLDFANHDPELMKTIMTDETRVYG